MLGNYRACIVLDDNVPELEGGNANKMQKANRWLDTFEVRGFSSALKAALLPGASVETLISFLVPKVKAGVCCTCFSGSYAVGAETFTIHVVQPTLDIFKVSRTHLVYH